MGAQSRAIGDAIRRTIEQVVKALVLEIDRELRRSTPIDTGHAKANWVPSLGEPFTGEASRSGSGSQEHAAGVAQVLRFKLGDGWLYVSNNVPYIHALNYGHSKQAPRLFVEAAVDRALATIQARYAGRISIDRASFIGSTAGGVEMLGGELAENMASAYSPFGD
jgi:hypothetical protein